MPQGKGAGPAEAASGAALALALAPLSGWEVTTRLTEGKPCQLGDYWNRRNTETLGASKTVARHTHSPPLSAAFLSSPSAWFGLCFDSFNRLLPIGTATGTAEIPDWAPSELGRGGSPMSPVRLRGFHKDFKDVPPLPLSRSGTHRALQHQPKHSTATPKAAETCLDRILLTWQPARFCWEHRAFTAHPSARWLSRILEYHLPFCRHRPLPPCVK